MSKELAVLVSCVTKNGTPPTAELNALDVQCRLSATQRGFLELRAVINECKFEEETAHPSF
jgi:hypothetical protein